MVQTHAPERDASTQSVATRNPAIPPARYAEYIELSERDRKLLNEDTLRRWTEDLTDEDWTLVDIAHLERRRQVALRTMRETGNLTDTEFKLFRYLQRNERKTRTYVEIARHLWQTPERRIPAWMVSYDSTMVGQIQTLVYWIRKKLEIDPLRPQHIATIRGVGYRFYAAPPAMDDGENYDKRATESAIQRAEMRDLYGITEGTFVATADGSVTLTVDDEEGASLPALEPEGAP
jgi:hypothetical protein